MEEIRVIMNNSLLLDQVQRHFLEKAEGGEPFVVCSGVSVDVFNQYFAYDECLPIALRFVERSADGRILIIDFPSPAHEGISRWFESEFLDGSGNKYEIGVGGSTTARRSK
jgi:hypothetical protein